LLVHLSEYVMEINWDTKLENETVPKLVLETAIK